MPRWGLVDRVIPAGPAAVHTRRGASSTVVRATLLAAGAVFAVAAAAHLLRYVLLLVNRSILLPPLVAAATLLLGILASLAAIAAVIAVAAVTTSWLVGRRAVVYRQLGRDDPRPEWQLWAGCVIPVVNLVWAPVFAIELAHAERSGARLRGRITAWWIAWVFSTAVSAWAIWTSTATEPQAIADNTVSVLVAYLAGLAVVVLLWRVLDGFVRTPVDRPSHRWVVVGEQEGAESPGPERSAVGNSKEGENADPGDGPSRDDARPAVAVESGDREPAA